MDRESHPKLTDGEVKTLIACLSDVEPEQVQGFVLLCLNSCGDEMIPHVHLLTNLGPDTEKLILLQALRRIS